MDTGTLIDTIIANYDNVSSSDTDNSDRETRILQYAQETFDQVWYFREWTFRKRSGTVSITDALTYGNLPSDFHEFGQQGCVLRSDGARLEEGTPSQIFEDQQILGATATPQRFAVYGQDSTTGQKQINLSTPSSGTTTLTVFYLAVAPTLVNTTGNTSKLAFIPAGYHNSVILPGVVAKLKHSEGDSRQWFEMFTQGLARMVVNERPRKTAIQKLPLTTGMW